MKNVSPEGGTPQQVSPEILPFDAAGDDGCSGAGSGATVSVGGLVIRAPRGVQSVKEGYDIWAVEFGQTDGEEDVFSMQPMSGCIESIRAVISAALDIVNHPKGRGILVTATHVVINDHTGREVYRHGLVKEAA